ncbi:hypothetical protein [Thalassotalea marina]|uniref:Uncharacterized protein n=1 Tax=Thalassotalea marina TaxID=1673741 RepID=A0A919BA85_9GAMM|nr:hypothetical protein [Thalassotalea marina]GHF77167.1 hypothetical protein GCM10017161_00160 [Thalassotalea marina]
MAQQRQRDPLIERRHFDAAHQDLWSELTLAQKFSASSLLKYGYELAFIRHSSKGNVAFMTFESNVTTIDIDGALDTLPDIKLR